MSALHARCPFPDERVELAESLYEEETGRISGCNVSHPELFIRFGRAVGTRRAAMVDGDPLPGTAAPDRLVRALDHAALLHRGAAATNLAAEGQVPGAFAPLARALEKHYGLSREQVAFWDVHEEADREHSDIGDHVVIRYATSPEWQAKVRAAVERSLTLWWQFFDDIARAVEGWSNCDHGRILGPMSERRRYRKKTTSSVTAVHLDLDTTGFTYRKWGAEQRCKQGDWIVDNDGDVYTVDADVFARTYRRVSQRRLRQDHARLGRSRRCPWCPSHQGGRVALPEGRLSGLQRGGRRRRLLRDRSEVRRHVQSRLPS